MQMFRDSENPDFHVYFFNMYISLIAALICLKTCMCIADGMKKERVILYFIETDFLSSRDLKGVEGFTQLEELVADSNLLNDNTTFPSLPNLHTLTLNKNEISLYSNTYASVKIKSSFHRTRMQYLKH